MDLCPMHMLLLLPALLRPAVWLMSLRGEGWQHRLVHLLKSIISS